METGDNVLVAVRGLAVGGASVGRVTGPDESPLVGMTAFVPFAAPGETVRATVTKQEKRFLEADLTEVVEASPDRITPTCPYFGTCGGCDIQHMAYPAQLAAKREMVVGAFRAGGFEEEALERIAETVPGPPYRYRQRIVLHINKGLAGYYRRGTRGLLPIAECPVAVDAIEKKIADSLEMPVLTQGELTLEAGENGVFAILRTGRLPEADQRELLRWMSARFAGGRLVTGTSVAGRFGAETVQRRVHGLNGLVEMAPGEFAQANPTVNAALVAKVLAIAEASGAATACDLYSASGNFSLPLAAMGLKTSAVEEIAALVEAGREEANRRGLSERLTFHETTVERFLLGRTEPADLFIADPPRAGLEKLAGHFDFGKDLILVSCHLPSAVRDIKELVRTGWTIQEITPFDMFAQTTYVELLTHLKRTTG